jgi:hypothetical protein
VASPPPPPTGSTSTTAESPQLTYAHRLENNVVNPSSSSEHGRRRRGPPLAITASVASLRASSSASPRCGAGRGWSPAAWDHRRGSREAGVAAERRRPQRRRVLPLGDRAPRIQSFAGG